MKLKKSFYSRRSYKLAKKSKIALFIVCILAALGTFIWFCERNVQQIMISLAKKEATTAAQEATRFSLDELRKSMGERLNQLLIIDKNPDGKISSIKLNSTIELEIYNKISEGVQKSLKQLEDKPVKLKVGEIFHSNILANYGPTIDLKIWPKGSTKVSITPKLESKGINMVSVSLNAQIYNEIVVIVPFSQESLPISYDYPIAQTLIVGEVPNYYFDSNSDTPIPAMPIK